MTHARPSSRRPQSIDCGFSGTTFIAAVVRGSRAVVALLGEPQMDDLVSGLSPVLHEPLMRVVLRGDVKRLLGGAVLSAQAMLRAAANERLPRQQRHAAFDLALRDVFADGLRFAHEVCAASGEASELYRVLEWLRRGWHAAQTPLDLGALVRGAAPPELGGEDAVWRELGAVVHRTRVAGKEARAAVRPEYVRALLPPFEAVLREACRG